MGRNERTGEGEKYPEVSSVRGRKYWYSLEDKIPGLILMQMINNDRFLIFENNKKVYVDHLFEYLINDNDSD